MARFQLTLSPAYVPTWGVYEAIREAVQNALDARDAGYPMTVSHSGDTLTIQNDGVVLDRAVWLIGNTSKEGTDARGHYGEGLKLGALAAVRLGRKLRILNGFETWACTLEDSTVFPGQQVLTVSTRASSRVQSTGVAVQIECSADEWAEYSQRFLALRAEPAPRISVRDVDILTGDTEKGALYVGGIEVERREDMQVGYDFSPSAVRTDRDRRMINSFDLSCHVGGAWIDALQQDLITPVDFLSRLMEESFDATAIGDRYCNLETQRRVATAWQETYGPLTVPVSSHGDADRASHLGRVGRIVNKAVCAFFAHSPELSLEGLSSQQRTDVVRGYAVSELNPAEQQNLTAAIRLIDRSVHSIGTEPIAQRTAVVDFKADDLLGTHSCNEDTGESEIRVARKTLDTFAGVVRVLVHEAAHDLGGDGNVSHERAEGKLFSAIVADLIFRQGLLALQEQPLGASPA
jgi:hypothetical protein